ncbi:AlpA family phage regulatory protein [Shinella oryzae]|uniref:AlpA family phage regulatory protein n=1 Tax=Shinella oryzae TaxID=2871820 RepID=A0ABY9K6L0_9HYPH|nr:AlpA family phage regulatory protein [Shinella oryzae]WLS04151.1 AlpA family phage regulatory protein [Shinella oryzae]
MTKVIPHLKGTPSDHPSSNEFPATGYVRVKQILAPLGPLPISRSGFWAGVKCGKFPRPRKISSRVTVWRAEDILALLSKIDNDEL